MIIVGSSALQGTDGAAILANTIVLADNLRSNLQSGDEEWKVLNVLHRLAGQVGALDVGYQPGPSAIKEVRLCICTDVFELRGKSAIFLKSRHDVSSTAQVSGSH